ncbi:MAG: MATE family efflux transporter [Candidatus Coatesbacteria bacterium]|nr:MATE family efflux transporter [Candidatus Coatesbacteria bacterium]
MAKLDLDNKSLYWNIWQLAWPAALAGILMNFAHIVDRIFIGSLGVDQVTAAGFAGSVIWFIFSFIQIVAAGAVAIVARHWGAEEFEEADASGHRAVWLAAILGLFFVVLVYFAAPLLIGFYRPTPTQFPLAVDYLRIFAPGFGAMMVAFTVHSVFSGSGDTRTGMFAFVSINGINVLLNWLLIFGHWGFPALGLRGAALATTISHFLGTGVIFLAYAMRWSNVSIKGFFANRPRWIEIKRFLRIGLPATGQAITRPLTGMAMMALASRLTTEIDGVTHNLVATAFTIGMTALSFGQFFAQGLMAAPAPLVGQFLGRKDPGNAHKAADKVSLLGVIIQIGMALVLIFFGRQLASIFLTNDGSGIVDRILSMSHNYLIFIGLGSIISVLAWTYGGAFRGAGDTKPPMWGAIIANWAVKLPLAVLGVYVFGWHDYAIWGAVFASQIAEGIYVWLRFRRGRWAEVELA